MAMVTGSAPLIFTQPLENPEIVNYGPVLWLVSSSGDEKSLPRIVPVADGVFRTLRPA
jgi:hypothetical protein